MATDTQPPWQIVALVLVLGFAFLGVLASETWLRWRQYRLDVRADQHADVQGRVIEHIRHQLDQVHETVNLTKALCCSVIAQIGDHRVAVEGLPHDPDDARLGDCACPDCTEVRL